MQIYNRLRSFGLVLTNIFVNLYPLGEYFLVVKVPHNRFMEVLGQLIAHVLVVDQHLGVPVPGIGLLLTNK